MKAQRRHELKQNSLAYALQNLPETGKKFGSQIALGIILVVLVILWARYHYQNTNERITAAQLSLSQANSSLRRLQTALETRPGKAQPVAQERRLVFAQGMALVDDAIERVADKNPQLKALALLCRGDLNYTMANLPDVSGAATQPSLRPDQPLADLLSSASDAYNQVLMEFPSDDFATASAHFGLASVAEDRAALTNDASQWETARAQYQAIVDTPSVTPAFRNLAMERLQSLVRVQEPLSVNLGLRPATQPTTQPLMSMPTTMPSMSPTMR